MSGRYAACGRPSGPSELTTPSPRDRTYSTIHGALSSTYAEYFSDDNAKANKDTVPYKELTPIVLVDNKFVGKGWAFFDSLGQATKRNKERQKKERYKNFIGLQSRRNTVL